MQDYLIELDCLDLKRDDSTKKYLIMRIGGQNWKRFEPKNWARCGIISMVIDMLRLH